MQEMREPSPPSPDAPLVRIQQVRNRRDSVANTLTMRLGDAHVESDHDPA
jgi:hypothetical protein